MTASGRRDRVRLRPYRARYSCSRAVSYTHLGSFKVNCPGQLSDPHGLEVLDASRLPRVEVDEACAAAIQEGRLTAVNMSRPGWEALLDLQPSPRKKRVNVLAIGDVGSTLLMGLKLLGGDVIESIGILSLIHI